MPTIHDEANDPPDTSQVEQELNRAVKRCRMVVRKGRQLLELSQSSRAEDSRAN
jgi:hypothetical protein